MTQSIIPPIATALTIFLALVLLAALIASQSCTAVPLSESAFAVICEVRP
jgi:hypothetical protein